MTASLDQDCSLNALERARLRFQCLNVAISLADRHRLPSGRTVLQTASTLAIFVETGEVAAPDKGRP